jgi:hypothetical protein
MVPLPWTSSDLVPRGNEVLSKGLTSLHLKSRTLNSMLGSSLSENFCPTPTPRQVPFLGLGLLRTHLSNFHCHPTPYGLGNTCYGLQSSEIATIWHLVMPSDLTSNPSPATSNCLWLLCRPRGTLYSRWDSAGGTCTESAPHKKQQT